MSQTPNQALSNTGLNFTPTIHHDTYPFISPTASPLPRGRSVFITGASKGIGRATALSYARAGFARIGVGARSDLTSLAAACRAAATAAGHPAPHVHAVALDVTSRGSVDSAAASVGAAFAGRLDVLVANAGAMEPFERASAAEPAAWWAAVEVNLLGTFLTWRFFADLLRAAGGLRSFVVLSSVGALNATVGGSAYRAAKLAVLRFVEQVGWEEEGVLAFGVHPGGVPTELAWGMGEELGRRVLVDKVELAADSLVWLTRERREWLQGRYVSCNWDMEELEAKREEIVEADLLKVRMAVAPGN